ncbi:MAG TPA: YdjY domain-containing protein, partial [Gemmataceae bacterium]
MRPLLCATALALLGTGALPAREKGLTVDKENRAVRIPARVAPRKLEHLKEVYPVEVIACWPHPKGKKAHETVVTIDAAPSDVHKALEELGLKPGRPARGDGAAEGPEVNVYLEVPGADGRPRRLSIHRALIDLKSKKPLPASVRFRFTGSVMSRPDPNKPEMVYGADRSGTLIAVFPVTDETVLQTSLTMKEEKYLKLDTNRALLPAEGT